jgi:hypothetical protein
MAASDTGSGTLVNRKSICNRVRLYRNLNNIRVRSFILTGAPVFVNFHVIHTAITRHQFLLAAFPTWNG